MSDKPNMDAMIETKLTKSEAIDLLIQEMKLTLDSKRKELDRERKEIAASISVDVLYDALAKRGITVEYDHFDREICRVTANLRISELPPIAKSKLLRIREIGKEIEDLGKQEYQLNDKRAKTVVLKTMLEGSETGRQFLALIDGLKVKVGPKLLKS